AAIRPAVFIDTFAVEEFQPADASALGIECGQHLLAGNRETDRERILSSQPSDVDRHGVFLRGMLRQLQERHGITRRNEPFVRLPSTPPTVGPADGAADSNGFAIPVA